ncbi:uncharacterized protein PRCAT00003754001 [Priceomyces carsonii]|uniref:uncharacterized protein n=1 Tax=Priceomyces carsonii TaxID=28549 RepID=UPI002EDA3EE0|nr:unnamed protein product [Priceomyces carsonii]
MEKVSQAQEQLGVSPRVKAGEPVKDNQSKEVEPIEANGNSKPNVRQNQNQGQHIPNGSTANIGDVKDYNRAVNDNLKNTTAPVDGPAHQERTRLRDNATFSWKNVGSWDSDESVSKKRSLQVVQMVESYVTDHFYGDWYWNCSLMIGTCFFSWLVARIGGGILSFVMVLLFTNSVYRLEFRRFNRNIRDDMTRVEASNRLDQELETMEWLNSFMDKFWVIYMPALSEQVMFQANEVLKDQAPGMGIEALSLDEFTLGSKAPRVNSIKSYPKKGRDHIEMVWAFSFAPNDTDDMTKNEIKKKINPKVALGVTIGKAFISKSLPILVEDMSFTGRMNIKLKLNDNFPHVKMVSIQFLEAPTIDYALKPVGGDSLGIDVMSFIPGLSSFVNGLIHANLRPMLYAPNSLDIDVEEIIAQQSNDSNGVVAVTIKRMSKLKVGSKTEPNSLNPYVQLTLSGNPLVDERTSVKSLVNDPVYLETKYLLTNTLESNHLSFNVFNLVKDKINDQLIGVVDFSLGDLLQKSNQTGVVRNISQDGQVVGKIEFDIRYFSSLPPMELEDGTKIPVTDTEIGIMKLTLHGAKDLDISESVIGLLNPYAEIYVNQELMKSCRRLRQINEPSWNQGFESLVTQQSETQIQVLVKDSVENKVVGKLDANLQDLIFETNRGQQWIKCPPASPDGPYSKIRITAHWKALSMGDDKAVKSYYSAPIGGLRIHLRSASNVKNLEAVGKVDPYVRVLMNGKIKARTKTINDTLTPYFNDVCFLPVSNSHQHVLLEIMDEEEETDRSLGTVAINVHEFLEKNDEGYYMGYDGSNEILEQPILYNGDHQGILTYSVSFIPNLPVYTISETENKDLIAEEKEAKEADDKAKRESEEKLVKEHPDEYEFVEVTDDSLSQPPKIVMPLEDAIKYRTGTIAVHLLNGKFDKPDLYVHILFDDQAYPSGVSPKSEGKSLTTISTAEGFIRDLPNSKMIVRLAKKVEVNDEKDIILEKTFDTIDIYERGNAKPIILRINERNHVEAQLEFFPSPSKLAPLDTILDVGKMKLEILSAENLKSVDKNGKSDPLLAINLDGVEVFRTSKKRKTLDPVWNETFEYPILSRSRQITLLEVYDWDLTHDDELLGRVNLDLSTIEPFDSTQFKVKLDTQGIINLRATFKPEYIRPKLNSAGGLPFDLSALTGVGGAVIGGATNVAGAGVGVASEGLGKGVGVATDGLGKGGSFIKGLGRRKRKSKEGSSAEDESTYVDNSSSLYSGKTAQTNGTGGHSPRKNNTSQYEDDIHEEDEEEDDRNSESDNDNAENESSKTQTQHVNDMESITSKPRHKVIAAPNVNPDTLPPPQRPYIPNHDRKVSSSTDISTYTNAEVGSGGIPGRVGVVDATGFSSSALEVKVLLKSANSEKALFKTRSSKPDGSRTFKWNESSPFKAPSDYSLVFIVREHHTFGKNVEVARVSLPLEDALNNQENISLQAGSGKLRVLIRYITIKS